MQVAPGSQQNLPEPGSIYLWKQSPVRSLLFFPLLVIDPIAKDPSFNERVDVD